MHLSPWPWDQGLSVRYISSPPQGAYIASGLIRIATICGRRTSDAEAVAGGAEFLMMGMICIGSALECPAVRVRESIGSIHRAAIRTDQRFNRESDSHYREQDTNAKMAAGPISRSPSKKPSWRPMVGDDGDFSSSLPSVGRTAPEDPSRRLRTHGEAGDAHRAFWDPLAGIDPLWTFWNARIGGSNPCRGGWMACLGVHPGRGSQS